MKIFFVRHGESMANASGTIGTPTTPLAEAGLEQARRTGQDLRGKNITLVVCSSYLRAQQTAEIIAGELGLPVADIKIIDELRERSAGELEGKPKRHETSFFYANDTEFGFESQADLIARLDVAIAKIRELGKTTSGRIVVVGHAASGFYLRQVLLGHRQFADFEPVRQMENAEFLELEIPNEPTKGSL